MVSDSRVKLAQWEFNHYGCVRVSWMIPDRVRRLVAEEAVGLADTSAVRRDLALPATGFTPRRMANVTRSRIVEQGCWIPRLYGCAKLIRVVSAVAGESAYLCPYQPEQYVITRLDRTGDTHGWHWDDYRFALVWVAECPEPRDGGYVECVAGTTWNKQNPGIDRILDRRKVHQLTLGGGDVYLMRTDTTLHRVHPIRRGRRTIVNMAYAAVGELCKPVSHETMDALWSVPAG